MKKIATFKELLALPQRTKIYHISNGSVFAECFIAAYNNGEWDMAVIDLGGEIEKVDWQDFIGQQYFLEITEAGAREIMMAQIADMYEALDKKKEVAAGHLHIVGDFTQSDRLPAAD